MNYPFHLRLRLARMCLFFIWIGEKKFNLVEIQIFLRRKIGLV